MTEIDPILGHRAGLALARDSLEFFALTAFRVLYDEPYLHNWHVAAIAFELSRLAEGDFRRLIITMPPRTLKSFLASICLPAWLLGRRPGEKIICASYAQPLSSDFAFQMRQLMESSWYREVFPGTHIDPRKSGVDEIRTTRGGFRLSTSVGGSLTGRGGNFIIIDDPIKAADAQSEAIRLAVENWYKGTVASRFNNQNKGRIVMVAQRLHMEDLPGQLAATGSWRQLDLPLEASRTQTISIDKSRTVTREAGDILHEARFSRATIRELRGSLGNDEFEAQYNQRPLPPGGAVFRLEWLRRYEQRPHDHHIQAVIQSWDTAYDVAGNNDYSVCSTWAVSGTNYYLLHIFRARLQFPDLEQAVHKMRSRWKADLVLVENAGSGKSVAQNITHTPGNFWLRPINPQGSKQDRALKQTSKFARGRVWLPSSATWLKAFEDELASFPQARHDDQVDSVVQFLAAVEGQNFLQMVDVARQF